MNKDWPLNIKPSSQTFDRWLSRSLSLFCKQFKSTSHWAKEEVYCLPWNCFKSQVSIDFQLLNKHRRARQLSTHYSFKNYAAEHCVTVIWLKHILQTSIHS